MVRNLVIILALCMAGWGFGLMLYDAPSTGPSRPAVAGQGLKTDPVDFAFRTIGGQSYELSDFAGKTVLVHFFASWCAPCVIEFPELIDAMRDKKETVVLIAISSDNEAQDLTRFLKRYAPDLPGNVLIVRDNAEKALTEGVFGTYKLPETYILGPDLTIREKIIGAYGDWDTIVF